MKTKPKDGGQAFPLSFNDPAFHGMSLRDWFAGMALRGVPASVDFNAAVRGCYAVADAMLAERAKDSGQ